jgi:hypothetical protein
MNFAYPLGAGLLLCCVQAAPANAQARDSDPQRSDIVVTGIAADDSYAPEEVSVAGKSPPSCSRHHSR